MFTSVDTQTCVGDLADHLRQYGIRHFASNDYYWEWGAKRLGPMLTDQVDRMRMPLLEERVTAGNLLAFYDFIANPKVSGVVHSMNADAIRACGEFGGRHLHNRKKVLDLGCNVGYLSTWFARLDSQRQIVGVDLSAKSIEEAAKRAKSLGIANVRFEVCDLTRSVPGTGYDAIVDCQTLFSVGDVRAACRIVRSAMSPDGVLVSIVRLFLAEQAREIVQTINSAGLKIDYCQWIHCSDLGGDQLFLGTVASLHQADSGRRIDFDEQCRLVDELP